MPDGKRVILVGHCGPDSYALKSAVSRMLPGSTVVLAFDEAAFAAELPAADLLLINRVLDGDYAHDTGVDLIRAINARDGRKPAMMLVSNYPEAQAEAQSAGALPGFGKRDLNTPTTAILLRKAVGE